MIKSLHHLSEWLENIGISSEEKIYFFNDVNWLFDKARRPSLQFLNQELEDFGWGVQILNETMFNQMMMLHRHKFLKTDIN